MYFGLFWFLEINHKAFPYVSISCFSVVLLLISVEVTSFIWSFLLRYSYQHIHMLTFFVVLVTVCLFILCSVDKLLLVNTDTLNLVNLSRHYM